MADRNPRKPPPKQGSARKAGAPGRGRGSGDGTPGRRQQERRGSEQRKAKTRDPQRKEPSRPLVHLADDVVAELKHTARPGKGEVLVQVFAEAATAFAEEDFEEAIRLGEQAKHIALRAGAARELLGLAYYRSERYKEAARELSAYRRISGSTEQNPVIGDCYRAMKKPEKAVELIDDMRRSVPEPIFYEGQIVAAGALAEMGRLDDAVARMESLKLEPANAEEHHLRAWYVLGDLLERKGRFTQAKSYFDAVASADAELTDAPERARKLQRR